MNLTNAGTWRAPVHELIPVGPLSVRIRPMEGLRPQRARLLVAGKDIACPAENGWLSLSLASLVDHEVIVVE